MSKFSSLAQYEEKLKEGYQLLPFRFDIFKDDTYILTNVVGQYHLLARDALEQLINHRLPAESESYKDLKGKHFIMDSESSIAPELLALKWRTKLSGLSDFTSLHIFVVSLRCEHSCPYCQVSRQSEDKAAFDMSKETADRALAFTFRSPARALKIEFQGGESLLNFELIKYIVIRAKEINLTEQRELQFVIATNLAIVTDEILTFCREHEILISTSLDGPEDLHNHNRPRPGRDSHQRAIAGIERARTFIGKDRVSALMTTTVASLTRVKDIIDEYVRRDFDGVFLRPISPYGFAIKTKSFTAYQTQDWLKFYYEGLDYIIKMNLDGFHFVEHYAAIILTKMLSPFNPGYVDLMNPAGIGIAAIVYNYDGDIYASDEGRMLAEMKDKTFRLGNLHTDTFEQVMMSDALLNPLDQSFTLSVPMCADCAFEPFCGADPVYHHATQNDFIGLKARSSFCNRNLSIFRHLIHLMESNDRIREVFWSWIGR